MNPVKSTGSTKKESKMITFFNRKGKLYVQFEADGKKYQRSTKLQDTPKNRTFVKKEVVPKLQLKIVRGEFNRKSNDTIKPFKFYAEKYLKSKDSLKTYHDLSSRIHNMILPIFGNKSISDIKRYEIKEFADERLKSATPKTVKDIINTIVAIIDIAVDYEVVTVNVAKNIPLPKHIKKEFEPFSISEVSQLIGKSNGWFQVFLAISFYTGARTGEVLALNWNDIHLDEGYISITKSLRKGIIGLPKTKSSVRDVPIFDALMPYLKEHMRNSKSIMLFVNPRTGNKFYKSAKLTPYWKELLEECNLEYRIIYSTRHTFISSMLKNSDLSMLDIAQIVGHSNTEMIVRNYAKFIKGEQLKIRRDLNIFTDKTTDMMA